MVNIINYTTAAYVYHAVEMLHTLQEKSMIKSRIALIFLLFFVGISLLLNLNTMGQVEHLPRKVDVFSQVFFGKLSVGKIRVMPGPNSGRMFPSDENIGAIQKSDAIMIKGEPLNNSYYLTRQDFQTPYVSAPKFDYREGRRYLVCVGEKCSLSAAQKKILAYQNSSRLRSVNKSTNHTIIIDLDETMEETTVKNYFTSVERKSLNMSPETAKVWFEEEIISKISKEKLTTHDAVCYFSEPVYLNILDDKQGGAEGSRVEAVFHLQGVMANLDEWVSSELYSFDNTNEEFHHIFYPYVKLTSIGTKVISAELIVDKL